MEEISGKFIRETVRWSPETAVLSCESRAGARIAVICDCELNELEPGMHYRFAGSWTPHKRYGLQFKASSYAPEMPVTERAILDYLKRFSGVGEKTASLIYARFGSETLDRIAEDPLVLTQFGRVKEDAAKDAGDMIRRDLECAKTQLELASYLSGYGFPREMFRQVFQDFGAKAMRALKVNPYLTMKYDRVGFLLADKFALETGFPPVRLKRQALAILHFIEGKGDVWVSAESALAALRNVLTDRNFKQVRFRDAVRLLIRAKKLAGRKENGVSWLAAAKDAQNEEIIAEELGKHLIPNHELEMDLEGLSDSQAKAITEAVRLRIGCFTGGPGTGKTYSVARFIKAVIAKYGASSICVVAPTGKAMVRSKEALEQIGIRCETRTLHSLLLAQESGLGGNWQFIVSDESSMIDADLMRRFLVNNATSSILLVGDDGQLPPVGKGRPFADILASGVVPVGKLTETRRNSGLIVEACHAVRNERIWKPVQFRELDAGNNLALIQSGNFLQTIEKLVGHYRQSRDIIKEMQVITGVNKGENGTFELNNALRGIMNPTADLDEKYSLDDPVICLKNGNYLDGTDENFDETESEDGQIYVSNGEIGYVIAIRKGMAIVDFGAERIVRFRFGNRNFNLAYAVTCHKMQGSETPIAVILLDTSFGAGLVCSREWLYTAISRAKQICILIGRMETAERYCRKIGGQRQTYLTERIREKQGAMDAGTESKAE
ncbi:MAG: AAA family ATPase [Thermoguttaceae bacterium]|nr:AAA family ATPase [Thermoguttaceae bacterium]